MSWPLILSQYEKTILEDNSASLILAWLERVGLSTEEEISKDLGIEKSKLLPIILDLYQDRFVEYTENHVKVSESGKKLIDTLGISEEILKDLIKSLKLSDKYELEFYPICKLYREEAFSDYLNTISSIRTWGRLANSLGRKKTKKELENINIGEISIFLLSLRKWYVNSSLRIQDKEDARNLFCKYLDNDWPKSDYSELDSKLNNAMNWLQSYNNFLSGKNDIKDTLDENNPKSFFIIYIYFNEKTPIKLYNFWDEELIDCSLNVKKQINIREISEKILLYMKYDKIEDLKKLGNRDIFLKSHSYLSQSITSSEILNYLLFSESLDDFKHKSGITEEAARIFLEKIKYHCIKLVEEDENDTPE
ncbi:MAG: hypothetical protein IMF12_08320 [Proteobacteria bacterium]|nr:hypothetical protein [Pseudomonadota bacterium]